MVYLTYIVLTFLFVTLITETLFVIAFRYWLRKSLSNAAAEMTQWPKATILVPVRGADPEFERHLLGMLSQDYPDYELRVIVDSDEDTATEILQRTQESNSGRLTILRVKNRLQNCSLVCNSLVHGWSTLPDSTQVIVFMDGDLKCHPNLLRELIAPLQDQTVGGTFGNRWYIPDVSDRKFLWGSHVRRLWNAAAIIPMQVFGIAWGGCMAARRETLEAIGFEQLLKSSMVHDAILKRPLDRLGLKLQFVPSLIMVNREQCALPFAINFIKRQMLWTKLYHPNFTFVLLHAVLLMASLVALILGAVASALTMHGALALTCILSWVVYMAWKIILHNVLDSTVRQALQKRGNEKLGRDSQSLLVLSIAIMLTHAVYVYALLQAALHKVVEWRGIRYRIAAPFRVEQLNYQPFTESSQGTSL